MLLHVWMDWRHWIDEFCWNMWQQDGATCVLTSTLGGCGQAIPIDSDRLGWVDCLMFISVYVLQAARLIVLRVGTTFDLMVVHRSLLLPVVVLTKRISMPAILEWIHLIDTAIADGIVDYFDRNILPEYSTRIRWTRIRTGKQNSAEFWLSDSGRTDP